MNGNPTHLGRVMPKSQRVYSEFEINIDGFIVLISPRCLFNGDGIGDSKALGCGFNSSGYQFVDSMARGIRRPKPFQVLDELTG